LPATWIFLRELHRGYRCTLAYEVNYRDGQIDQTGRILAVDLVIHNRRLQAYYFDDGKGGGGYYAETGRSMKKLFRKSPVEFSRITSDYTLARFTRSLGCGARIAVSTTRRRSDRRCLPPRTGPWISRASAASSARW
jgi:hypothetical protein